MAVIAIKTNATKNAVRVGMDFPVISGVEKRRIAC